MNIKEDLLKLEDVSYRDFHSKLMPNIDKNRIIGIRVPRLRLFVKEHYFNIDKEDFFNDLPHYYYEENNLHILLIEKINNYDMCLEKLELFLPYIDNWATCDMVSLKILSKNRDDFLKHIKEWINSDHIYTIRLGVNMLMKYYLDDSFRDEFLLWVSQIKCNDYYVNMVISWFFATALVKQYCSAIIYLENRVLSSWRHNKTIQKAIESYRISDDVKKYLRSLKL